MKSFNETLPRFITVEAVKTTMKTVLTFLGVKDMEQIFENKSFFIQCPYFLRIQKTMVNAKMIL